MPLQAIEHVRVVFIPPEVLVPDRSDTVAPSDFSLSSCCEACLPQDFIFLCFHAYNNGQINLLQGSWCGFLVLFSFSFFFF